MIYEDIRWRLDSMRTACIGESSDFATRIDVEDKRTGVEPSQWFEQTLDLDEVVHRLDGVYERVEQELPWRVHVRTTNDATVFHGKFRESFDAENVLSHVIDELYPDDELVFDVTNVCTGEVRIESKEDE